jgi:hypothetical protein
MTLELLDVGGIGKQTDVYPGGMRRQQRKADPFAIPDSPQGAAVRAQGSLPESSVNSFSQAA